MNEQQTMIAEMADGLFAELGHRATIADGWSAVEGVGLPLLLVAERHGGFGGGWGDAQIVFRLAGYHGLALPLVEAIVAAAVSGDPADGRGTIAPASEGRYEDDRFTGVISSVPWGEGADYVVAPSPAGGAMLVRGGAIEPGVSIAGEPRATLRCDAVPAVALDVDIVALGALARSAQIAGALDAALALSVGYVNERRQFGRPLAKFQAVQQGLATFACEAAAANCAAVGAAAARDRGDATYEIAAAKLRTNRAVGTGTALAHQVHGAIGFTDEYPLHPLTRRLWAWRSEFGGDAHWARVLGDAVCGRGAEDFWADLVARSD